MALGHLADQLGALAVLAVWAPVNPWNFCSSYLFQVSLVEEAYPGRQTRPLESGLWMACGFGEPMQGREGGQQDMVPTALGSIRFYLLVNMVSALGLYR